MESEDADHKHETNTDNSAPRKTRSTRKRLPTGRYTMLNSEKTGEKKKNKNPWKN